MKSLLIIAGLLLNAISAGAQSGENKTEVAKIPVEGGKEIAISHLGNTRIIFKDGSIKKNCVIKEIKLAWVIYIKDKVLHDVEIDKIKRIDLDDGIGAIYFDKQNKPIVKRDAETNQNAWFNKYE